MKKGQGVGPIFALILLIGLFIVLFVLLLPPEDREELLNTSDGGVSDGGISRRGIETLILESPGIVSKVEEDKIEHKLNPINLFVKTEPEIIDLADSVSVKRGAFGGEEQNFAFQVEDLENLEDVKLSFFVVENEGKLLISLNGNSVFQGEVEQGSKIINLPTSSITNNNELLIGVSSPGLGFWKTNSYLLRDLKIKESFEKLNPQETRSFLLAENEVDSIEKSRLEYTIYCNSLKGEGSRFRIFINDELIHTETIPASCAGQKRVDINKDKLKTGENELTFVIEKGDYNIADIKIVNDIGEIEKLVYRFALSQKDIQDIEDNEKDVILELGLGEKNDRKKAEIVINGKSFSVDTTTDSYKKVLSDFVEEGDNIVKIVPRNEFRLNLVKITLEE